MPQCPHLDKRGGAPKVGPMVRTVKLILCRRRFCRDAGYRETAHVPALLAAHIGPVLGIDLIIGLLSVVCCSLRRMPASDVLETILYL
jgi:hypothetical protein